MTLKMYSYTVYIKSFGGGSSEPPAYGPVKDDTRNVGIWREESGREERGREEREREERGKSTDG